MNLQNDPQSFALMKFGIGQPVRRTEDPMLVRGEGCYTDDVKLAGEAYCVMVRSRVAHGVIKGIDTAAARNMPGVLGVYTGADLAVYGTLKCIVPFNNRDGTPMKRPPRPALAVDKVRFVGDPVAFVVAAMEFENAADEMAVDRGVEEHGRRHDQPPGTIEDHAAEVARLADDGRVAGAIEMIVHFIDQARDLVAQDLDRDGIHAQALARTRLP